MKKLTIYTALLLFILCAQACNPNFYLRKNVHIETLRTHLSVDGKKSRRYADELETQYHQFITNFNSEPHAFKIVDADSADADMVLHIKKLSVPSNGMKAAAYGTCVAIMVMVPIFTRGTFFMPIWTQVQNATRVDYSLDSSLARQVKGQHYVIYNTPRKWGKIAIAARRHNRYFSAQLADMFDTFEREYKKKNGLK